MTTITASEARANLYRLIDEAASSHQPLLISGKRNKAVLIAEEDWEAIQETLFLLSVPGMRESIREGMETPVDECAKNLASSGLKPKGQELLAILAEDPFQQPPSFEKLVGDLAGAYSRRINIQH